MLSSLLERHKSEKHLEQVEIGKLLELHVTKDDSEVGVSSILSGVEDEDEANSKRLVDILDTELVE